jgi:hypothetical protein
VLGDERRARAAQRRRDAALVRLLVGGRSTSAPQIGTVWAQHTWLLQQQPVRSLSLAAPTWCRDSTGSTLW